MMIKNPFLFLFYFYKKSVLSNEGDYIIIKNDLLNNKILL